MRVDYELKWTKLTPVLRNDKATMARVLGAAREALGPANVIEMPSPSMGSEDFAWFAERVPVGASAHRIEDRRPRYGDPSRRLSVERAGDPARHEGDDARQC
jgi:metal-dependent amidase/aminoacylase/carboxypeptidase family protein